MSQIAIIGGGAWGTALAQVLAKGGPVGGHRVVLWLRQPTLAAHINTHRINTTYLPHVTLSPNILATTDWHDLAGCHTVFMTVPTQHVRGVAQHAAGFIAPQARVVLGIKGIERETGKLPHDVVADYLSGRALVLLAGPSFAGDVGVGLPTALTLAAGEISHADAVAHLFQNTTLRPYTATDMVGVALAGAMKNVLAIAAGMAMGLGLGDSARAAIITRGLAEITRLGMAMGGQASSFMVLAGLGDVVLTCTSEQSRNYVLGLRLGQGKSLSDATATSKGVTEGVPTATAALGLAQQWGVDLPITAAVAAVLTHQTSISAALQGLLSRPLRSEG